MSGGSSGTLIGVGPCEERVRYWQESYIGTRETLQSVVNTLNGIIEEHDVARREGAACDIVVRDFVRKLAAENADLVRSRDAWNAYSSHRDVCGDCAEDFFYGLDGPLTPDLCAEGARLRDAAVASNG